MNGIIVMWAGSEETIPSGWKLCDGNNGTPDLRDRFVIGAGSAYSVDDTAPTNVAANSGIAYYALCFIQKVP